MVMMSEILPEAIQRKTRRFAAYCAEAGRIRQVDLAAASLSLSQPTISRIMRGLSVASQTQHEALIALNKIRKQRGLEPVEFEDVQWTWE